MLAKNKLIYLHAHDHLLSRKLLRDHAIVIAIAISSAFHFIEIPLVFNVKNII